MSSDALGRNGALRKTPVLQNFAILWSCNMNTGEKRARLLLAPGFSLFHSLCTVCCYIWKYETSILFWAHQDFVVLTPALLYLHLT